MLHTHDGARDEAQYLVRPNGAVGFRSQLVEAQVVTGYLARLLGLGHALSMPA